MKYYGRDFGPLPTLERPDLEGIALICAAMSAPRFISQTLEVRDIYHHGYFQRFLPE